MPKRKHSCNLFVLLTLWIICVSVLFCRAVDEGAGSPAVLLEDDFAEFDEEEFIHEHVNEGRSNKINAADVHTKKAQLREEMGMMEEFPVAAPDDLEEDPNIEPEADAFVESEQYDPNEFEGFDDDRDSSSRAAAGSSGSGQKPPELKITEVPMVLGRNWEHYYVEYLLVCCLLLYVIWYASGKTTNSKLASAWLDSHLGLLNSHFALVGDDGTSKEIALSSTSDTEGTAETDGEISNKPFKFIKEADHVFTIWCSGRLYVEGMLVTLKLKKRQDLFTSGWRIFRPTQDQICVRFYMEKDEMDSFVLCVAKKSAVAKIQKDMAEVALFCPDRKSGDRFGLPSSFTVMSEIGESVFALLDTKVLAVIEKFEAEVEYLFFSDQYNPKPDDNQQQQTPLKRPEPAKIVQLCFNLPKHLSNPTEIMEYVHPLIVLSFYLSDKVHRYRLMREAKLKAEKNRQKVQEEYLKSTHAQRQEAAQQRREEKRRVEKERILSEDDPEKQRKWEERDYRRELKKRGPKVKAVKVKAM